LGTVTAPTVLSDAYREPFYQIALVELPRPLATVAAKVPDSQVEGPTAR
jgi:hypothetical protein